MNYDETDDADTICDESVTDFAIDRAAVSASAESEVLDTVLHLLANDRRRHALSCLLDADDWMAVTDVAREIAERERDEPTADVSTEEIERVAASLHHVHLPKMAEADVVNFHRKRDAVATGERVEAVRPFLELADE